MNEHEKYHIMIKTRNLLDACNELSSFLDNQIAVEENKKDNLSENLENSVIYTNIEQDIENLAEAVDVLADISSQIESFSELLGFKFRKQRSKKTIDSPRVVNSMELRTVRLQAVIPPSLACKLKATAISQKTSVNEILNRLLEWNLKQ